MKNKVFFMINKIQYFIKIESAQRRQTVMIITVYRTCCVKKTHGIILIEMVNYE